VLGLPERGHDYFIQITDARPDTGGLSGATPSEAVSWGKVEPTELPSAVVCYTDSTIALPLITAYLMNQVSPRPLRRLYDRRLEMLTQLKQDYAQTQQEKQTPDPAAPTLIKPSATYPCGTPIR
jgi:deoxyhypusine synthase